MGSLEQVISRNDLTYATRAAFVAAVASGKAFKLGAVVHTGGVSYAYDNSASDISDLPGWLPHGTPTPVHFGADGDSGDLAAFQALIDSTTNSGVHTFIVPPGTYGGDLATLTVGSRAINWIEHDASYSTSPPPGYRTFTDNPISATDRRWMVGGTGMVSAVGSNSENVLLVRSDTDIDPTLGQTVQIQRKVNQDPNLTNPVALLVSTDINVDITSTEWVISALLNNYSDTSSTGYTGISSTAFKYGLAQVIGMHCNAVDRYQYTNQSDTGGVVGLEVHASGFALDHPTSNSGNGNRVSVDVKAKPPKTYDWVLPEWQATTAYSFRDYVVPVGTNLSAPFDGWYYLCTTAGTSGGTAPTWPTTKGATVADGTAVWTAYRGNEQGVGVRIKSSESSTQGYAWFRYGLSIEDDYDGGNDNYMEAAIKIQTGGDYGIYMPADIARTNDIWLDANSGTGLACLGTYTTAAIRVAGGEKIALNSAGSVDMRYAGGVWIFEGATNSYTFDQGIKIGSYTAAQIADATHAVNTTGKTAGKIILDTTNYRIMVSTGSGATSNWNVCDNSAAVTPA